MVGWMVDQWDTQKERCLGALRESWLDALKGVTTAVMMDEQKGKCWVATMGTLTDSSRALRRDLTKADKKDRRLDGWLGRPLVAKLVVLLGDSMGSAKVAKMVR